MSEPEKFFEVDDQKGGDLHEQGVKAEGRGRRYGRLKWVSSSIGVVLVMAMISRGGVMESLLKLLFFVVQGGVVPCIFLLVVAEVYGRRRREKNGNVKHRGESGFSEKGEGLDVEVASAGDAQCREDEESARRDVEGLLFWGWLLFLMLACFYLFDKGEIAVKNGFGVIFK